MKKKIESKTCLIRTCLVAFSVFVCLSFVSEAKAATAIYRSVGPGATSDLNTNARTVEISGTTATFSDSMPDNFGVGDVLQYQVTGTYYVAFVSGRTSSTVYSVQSNSGGTPQAAATGTAVSVYRAYTSLSAAERGSENDSLNNTVEDFDNWDGTGDYTDADEVGKDLTVSDEQWNIVCYSGASPDNAATIISGWTTDATHHIKVYTPTNSNEVGASQRHTGKTGSGYQIKFGASNTYAMNIQVSNVEVAGIDIDCNAGNTGITVATGISGVKLYDNVIHNNTGISNSRAISIAGTAYVWNNIIYDFLGINYHAGIYASAGTIYAYNNTLYGTQVGFRNDGGTIHAKNNIVNNCSSICFYGTNYNASSANNLSSDNSAPGSNYIRGISLTFIDTVGKDFHLADSDTQAINTAADLSGEVIFTADIDRESRPQGSSWDRGADEYTIAPDSTAPTLSEVAPVTTPTNDATPDYTFRSDEGGSITYAGDCSSAAPSAIAGDNTITFNPLSEGTYSNCTITVTDVSGNASQPLNVSTFSLDLSGPTRSEGAPIGTLPADTTSTTISLTTNENGTCKYAHSAGNDYTAMTNTFSTTGGTSHSTTISDLVPGSNTFYVRCVDSIGTGNYNSDDYTISFTVLDASDVTPPERSAGEPSAGSLPKGTTQTSIFLKTNENATCKYATSDSMAYGDMPNTFLATGNTNHSTVISDLSNGNSYSYYVRCQDGNGNSNTDDYLLSFSVGAGVLDDFEGGINWGQAPWNAQYPLWNVDVDEGETSILETMNAEWYQYRGDFNGGPDFGYLTHDRNQGARNTNQSLRYTVTGGNKNAAQPPNTYGDGPQGAFYLSGNPLTGETFTVAGIVFTFQSASRTGAGQVQIGASAWETAQNMASAINADISLEKVHAVATTGNGWTNVTVSNFGAEDDGSLGVGFSESASNIIKYGTVVPQGNKRILQTYSDLQTAEPGAGNFNLYFGSAGGALTTGLHNRFVVPAAKRPTGSNRMTVWMKSPSFGSEAGDATAQRINIGTRVNSQERFDEFQQAGLHYYHQMDLPKSNYWTKVVINNNPDHIVSGGGYAYTPDDPTMVSCPDGYCFHYMEGMSHFYIEGTSQHDTPLPFNVWLDEVEIWHESRTENTEYVASREASYLGSNQFFLSWTGRWGEPGGVSSTVAATQDNYRVYYSTTPLNQNNFSVTGTLISGTFSRAAWSKEAKAVFSIPNYDVNQTYYFAIEPLAEPGTAGFIDYEASAEPDTDPPAFTIHSGTDVGPVQTDTINIAVSDAGTISLAEYGFSADATCNGSDTYGNAFSSGVDFTVAGDHTDYLCVMATDEASNTGYQLVGQLNTDNTVPTIQSVSSDKANGTYGVGEVIDLDVTFSEAVTATGNVTVTIETGDTDRNCTFTVSNATTGTCNYTVQAGDNSADLNVNSIAGTIADQAGNPMVDFTPATNLSDNKTLVIDTTPTDITAPTVTAFTIPATASSITVPITDFTAADDTGVTGYLLTESDETPSPSAEGWSATVPESYTFATAGSKTLYAWAKDAAGNVSESLSGSVTITLPTYTIGGTISGLTGTVVLQNNGGDEMSLTENGPFTFPTALEAGSAYQVTVSSQPSGQTCTVSHGSGTVADSNISSVNVVCTNIPIPPLPGDETGLPDSYTPSIGGSMMKISPTRLTYRTPTHRVRFSGKKAGLKGGKVKIYRFKNLRSQKKYYLKTAALDPNTGMWTQRITFGHFKKTYRYQWRYYNEDGRLVKVYTKRLRFKRP